MGEPTHVTIDMGNGVVYLQRLPPRSANETPLCEEERAILRLHAENERLMAAIRNHHGQKADDRCWKDDADLYAAAGLPPGDPRIGDKAAMLENCNRFIRLRCEEGGPWKSYAELEAMLEECWELLNLATIPMGIGPGAERLLRKHGRMK